MPTKTKAQPVEAMEEVIEGRLPEEQDQDFSTEEPEGAVEEAPAAEQPAQLTGAELMAFYQQKLQEGFSHDEIAFKAGYYSVTKNGQERVLGSRFSEALLEAQGFPVGGKRRASSGGGRAHAGLTRARVSGSGILLVSQLATRNVGAKPGAVFSVEYPGDGQILLTMTGEVKPVVRRKGSAEEPGAPLLDQAA